MIWDLLIHPSNIVFSISLMLCLFIGVLEFILLLFGGSSSFLEQFLPDSLTDVDHADVGVDHPENLFTQLLEWLYLGKVPLLIWLIIFLIVYALTGLIIQGYLLPPNRTLPVCMDYCTCLCVSVYAHRAYQCCAHRQDYSQR